MEKIYKKNDIVTLKIERIGINGEGIARLDNGMTAFVSRALQGETVEARIILIKKKYAVCRLEKISSSSSDRITPDCSVFGKCGGCQLQHMNYNAQLQFKTDLVKETLSKVGGIDAEVNPCLPSDMIFGYRNKIQLPVVYENCINKIGFFRENSHNIIEIDKCSLHQKWAEKLIFVFYEYMKITGVNGYDEGKKNGILRHIVARFLDGNLSVCAVINADALPHSDVLVHLLEENFSGCFGLFASVNRHDTNVIMGENTFWIAGNKSVGSSLNGVKFQASVESFLQINPYISEKIYNKIYEIVSANPPEIIIDAYSGIGILTALLSRCVKRAIGIEIVAKATQDANEIMSQNKINNVININADCGEFLPVLLKLLNENEIENVVLNKIIEYSKKDNQKSLFKINQISNEAIANTFNSITKVPYANKDNPVSFCIANNADTAIEVSKTSQPNITVILDPARKGCDEKVITSLNNYPVNNIIYISCNPVTLSRDLQLLSSCYTIKHIQPYDMFPQTSHVETVVLMSRVKE